MRGCLKTKWHCAWLTRYSTRPADSIVLLSQMTAPLNTEPLSFDTTSCNTQDTTIVIAPCPRLAEMPRAQKVKPFTGDRLALCIISQKHFTKNCPLQCLQTANQVYLDLHHIFLAGRKGRKLSSRAHHDSGHSARHAPPQTLHSVFTVDDLQPRRHGGVAVLVTNRNLLVGHGLKMSLDLKPQVCAKLTKCKSSTVAHCLKHSFDERKGFTM